MTPEEIIQTVHEIDRLEEQKRQRTSDLDARIAVLKERLSPTQGAQRPVSSSKASSRVAPMGKASPKKQIAVEYISTHPNTDYDGLISAIYGEVTDRTSDAAHSLIFDMKKRGVISGDVGAWRVIGSGPAPAAGGARKNGVSPR